MVEHHKEKILEYPMSKIKTITVAKKGVSLSSNLILECAARGIKFFFLDFKGIQVASVSPLNGHAVSNVRKEQFKFLESEKNRDLSRSFIMGKIHNQRAVLKYFEKYLSKTERDTSFIEKTCGTLERLYYELKNVDLTGRKDWRSTIFGIEGEASHLYWQTLVEGALVPSDFNFRKGRYAANLSNQVLNFGYSILSTMVWHCLVNSGLEIYAGSLHTFRPGKPSLVLDVMEEYRAWVVDRILIKHRSFFEKKRDLDPDCKHLIIKEVHETFAKKYPYHGKKLRLENILQRQVYRLSALFQGEKKFKPYLFRW